ncbi:lytic polysaccharide monooxygenase [Patellaria atrata CBS 101060]|uniref:Lytic polysaccharide monooxygenase n=1 Tax=Patellaria atrata CBS 101060 TaxID=1346257 RepID=A0A9P4VSK3_9PEZI|nr:lytic polysaccharide monooxygenase [Patellaria atrata CBS 101060]
MTRFSYSKMLGKGLLWLGLISLLGMPAHAHMKMSKPVPYGQDSLDTSPLSGGNFPCKQRAGVYTVTSMNDMLAGSDQTLEIAGGAAHGGGSCQISLSLDKEPTASSKFKVIHSIIGGCPGGKPSYSFKIPDDMPNGEYTLAWTWFNKIGNREMYMNCAPVKVTGGCSGNSAFDRLPDMFVANIASTQCKTPEMVNVVFPNPGDSVETVVSENLGTDLLGCGAPTGESPSAPAPSQTPGAGNPTPSVPATSMPATSAPAASAPAMSTRVVSAPAASAPAASTPAPSAPATSIPAAPVPSAPTPSAPVVAPPTSGNTSCSPDGALICNGEKQWGLCNFGKVVFQPVAPGTSCIDGHIMKKRGTYNPRGPYNVRSLYNKMVFLASDISTQKAYC